MKILKLPAVLLVLALVSVIAFTGCLYTVVGSGNLVSKDWDYSGFTVVDAGSAFEVEVSQASAYSVTITADDNVLDYIKVIKSGDAVKIRMRSGIGYAGVTLRAEITMPDIRQVNLIGAARCDLAGFTLSHDFKAELSGATSLQLDDISAANVAFDVSGASNVSGVISASGHADFNISGASQVELTGSADGLTADVSGASELELAAFPVSGASVDVSGVSRVTINTNGTLDGTLEGASQLLYIGNPALGDLNVSGASTIGRK